MSSSPAATVRPFPQRLAEAVDEKGGPVVVGLDPRPEWFPPDVVEEGRRRHDDPRLAAAAAIFAFNRSIIDAVADAAAAVKPQLAFYERYGWPGVRALEETIAYAKRKGLLVIVDGKRNDIGSTAAAYASAYLGGSVAGPAADDAEQAAAVVSGLEADALTVNPYLGSDGMQPFLDACRRRGKGLFVLVRTSNPSGAELQRLLVAATGRRGARSSPAPSWADATNTLETVAERVADLVLEWNEGMPKHDGFGPVGAVVGATAPEEAAALRRRMPGVVFLVPGYGAQGAGAAEAKAAFDARGKGAVINSARGVLYAWRRERPGEPGTMHDFAAAARRAVLRMRDELAAVKRSCER